MSNLHLALDLGTSTLAGRLLGSGGETLAEADAPNPQAELGTDVIRRLEAALDGADGRLQALLAGGIEVVLEALLGLAGASRGDIASAAAAGNPAICYLLRRLGPREILFPPHRPRERFGRAFSPEELGLNLPVPLYLFPLVSGYVGGDLIAFLYGFERSSSSPLTPHPSRLFIDLGTNGEMALTAGGRWWVTSVAAGPAFEGGGISCGMRALPGAVTGVAIAGDRLALQTVGDAPPRGICGSGLLEAIAAGREGRLIDARGTLSAPGDVETSLSRFLTEDAAGRALRLYRDAATDLKISQQDIRAFQLAKGAIRAGVACLLEKSGVSAGELEAVVVTGAFGFALRPQALKRVAMLPEGMVEKVRFAPAGVLNGVSEFLRDFRGAERVRDFAAVLRPYPFSGTPAFEKAFLHALDF